MNRLLAALDGFVIPGVLTLTWVMMYATMDMAPIAVGVSLFGYLVVVSLWVLYRELRAHAAASRMVAQGEPDELIELAKRERRRRWLPRAKVPFHIYESIALGLRGDWPASRAALDAADLDRIGGKARRSWGILHASQEIELRAHDGDAAGARRVLDERLTPMLGFVPGAGAEVIAREAEARVLVAEGKLDDARPLLEKLVKDVRLGPATRGIATYWLARCVEPTDPDEARALDAKAASLAPQTWVATAAAAAA